MRIDKKMDEKNKKMCERLIQILIERLIQIVETDNKLTKVCKEETEEN